VLYNITKLKQTHQLTVESVHYGSLILQILPKESFQG